MAKFLTHLLAIFSQTLGRLSLAALSLLLVLSLTTQRAVASTEYRQCTDTTSCEVGEFLFDDSYQKVLTASCTITSINPDGTAFLTNEPMSVTADGWYYEQVDTTGKPAGLYRTQVCCDDAGDLVCIDKTFEVVEPGAGSGLTQSDVADAVWNAQTADYNQTGSFGANLQEPTITVTDIWSYPSRSLTSFGSLVDDIWAYSNRSLSNVTSLVTSIWSASDRTLSSTELDSGGSLATSDQVGDSNDAALSEIQSDLNSLQSTTDTIKENTSTTQTEVRTLSQTLTNRLLETTAAINENRLLLEKIATEPIIETFIESGEPVQSTDLLTKIRETKQVAYTLSTGTETLQTQLATIDSNWTDSSYLLALNDINSATRVLGTTTDQVSDLPTDMLGSISWLQSRWDNPIISNLALQAESAKTNTLSIDREVKSYGKTTLSREYVRITNEHVTNLAGVIGDESDSKKSATLFGYIQLLEETNEQLTQVSADLDQLLTKYQDLPPSQIASESARIRQVVLEYNQVPFGEVTLNIQEKNDNLAKNRLLALQGLISTNFAFLTASPKEPVLNVWMEFGSIIFRSVVTNPSSKLTLDAPVKYYLPKEVRPEHVTKKDDWLELLYDADRDSYYVAGTLSLEPNETKTFSVEVADIWTIPSDELSSIRSQTNTLFEPLKNTSYFAQGATIKADIEASLDKVVLLQNAAQTPEAKIRAYREALVELDAARRKLEDLKTLVSAAGSVGTLFGFVGGVQTLAVWGLIIILVAGFVFLALYLKLIAGRSSSVSPAAVTTTSPSASSNKKTTTSHEATQPPTSHSSPAPEASPASTPATAAVPPRKKYRRLEL